MHNLVVKRLIVEMEGILQYLTDIHKPPPASICVSSKPLVENGWNVLWLVGLGREKQQCLGLCFQQIPTISNKSVLGQYYYFKLSWQNCGITKTHTYKW